MNTNNGGVTNVDVLSVGALYINGQRLKDMIIALQSGISLNQDQITAINAFLARLDLQITDPNILTLTNDNRNQVLKALIDALNTKTNYLDTTGLTSSWVVDNNNKNATLKTRIDGNDTSLGLLNTKTQYVTSQTGNNSTNPKVKSIFAVEVGDRDETQIHLQTTALNYVSVNSNNSNNTLNNVTIASASGTILLTAQNIKLNPFNSSDTIEIGKFGISNTGQINIGGSLSKINIGSVEDPIFATTIGDMGYNDNTIITIGKRTTLKNTLTYLNGNINTGDSRFISLSVTDTVTWETAASWLAGFVFSGVPYWLAWIGLTGTPNYRYSDCIKMANNYLTGGLTKNNSIETSNDLGLKKLTVIDTSVVGLSTAFDALLQRLVFQAFAVHGSHSIGSIWGQTDIYAGSGNVVMRCDGGAIDWAFKNAGNTNYVKVSNLDTEVVQCNGSGGNGTLKLGAFNGNIDMYVGTAGIQASGTKVIQVKSTKQVIIGDNDTQANRYDATTKLIIDQTNLNDGIKVCKASGSTTRINHDNINTPSINVTTLVPTNITGWNVKSLVAGSGVTLSNNSGEYTINSSGGASTLAQVLTAGNTANTSINMNNNNITNVGTITPTAITGWNVKSISASAGSGLSIANSSGAITISTTTTANDADAGFIVSNACALPSKPFWYNTIYSWLYNSSNVQTGDNYLDNCISNTGQYQLIVSADRIRSSVDWGVTWFNQSFTSFYLNSICITGSGNRYYFCGAYRVFYFDAIYSTFGSGGNYLTSFPTLSNPISYTRMKCSQDGKYILIGGTGGYATIYQSSDYGFTSTQQNTQGAQINIDDVAMSSDGKYQFLMFRQTGAIAGRVMYSNNYGVTFNSPTMPNSYSLTLIRVACSASGQYIVVINQSQGILFSTDYGKNYLYSSTTVTTALDICMSANGQFCLAITYNQVWFSEDYGRSFFTASGTLTGATPDLATIACSATGGYACVAGAGGRTWVIYDTPTDVRQLVAGTNITISPNGFGTYTIASSASGSANTTFSYYWGDGGTTRTPKITFTLGSTIDLRTNKLRCTLKFHTGGNTLTYPFLSFNNLHTYPTSNNTTYETSQTVLVWNGGTSTYFPYPNSVPSFSNWSDYSPCFTGVNGNTAGSDTYWVLLFDVDLEYDVGQNVYKQIVARGTWSVVDKTVNSQSNIILWSGSFIRTSDLGTYLLGQIAFGSYYNNAGTQPIRGASLFVEVVPTSYSAQNIAIG